MKKILNYFAMTIFAMFLVASVSFAGKLDESQQYNSLNRHTYVLKEMNLKDINRIITTVIPTMKEMNMLVKNLPAKIINAKRLDATHFVIRMEFGERGKDDTICEDFFITPASYTRDETDKADIQYYIGSDKVYTANEMVKLYGPSCFYFGVFDDNTHDICGFGIAERIKRWPEWSDLSYKPDEFCFKDSNIFSRFTSFANSIGDNFTYNEKSSQSFVEEHPNM